MAFSAGIAPTIRYNLLYQKTVTREFSLLSEPKEDTLHSCRSLKKKKKLYFVGLHLLFSIFETKKQIFANLDFFGCKYEVFISCINDLAVITPDLTP
jgi:hypothetical protein